MTGLITFEDKSDPKASFVLNTRMPLRKIANLLSAIKIINAIRHGECPLSDAEIRRAAGLGPAIKQMIALDNERYYRLFGQLRAVVTTAQISPPDLRGRDCPHFEIADGQNDVTLTRQDFGGRGCIVYDVGKLFNREQPANPSDAAWKGIIDVVLSAWTLAEASSIHPEPLNKWTSCSKKTL